MAGLPAWWLTDSVPSRLLSPLGALFAGLVTLRRSAYRRGWLHVDRLPVPVVVVGNIFVGGTGKTPFVAWLVNALRDNGWHPGIVCRGYGGGAKDWPQPVSVASDAGWVGDEPVLLARRTGVPVVAGPDRLAAGRRLLAEHPCDVLILDDGLQHYRLGRDYEIAVIDGRRGLGNGRCLPAGPLREPASRLDSVDLVVENTAKGSAAPGFSLQGESLRSVDGTERGLALADLAGRQVHAVAGIGDPERFFGRLEQAGLVVHRHAFPDHHAFRAGDLAFDNQHPIVMTEKDAVKCAGIAPAGAWYLEVSAQPNAACEAALAPLIERLLSVGGSP